MLIAVTKIYCPNRKVVLKIFEIIFYTPFQELFFSPFGQGKKDVKGNGHFGNN